MVRIDGEIVIHRRVDEVFDFVADEGNEPRYSPRLLCAMSNTTTVLVARGSGSRGVTLG
jgi:hypothetical protein